MNIEEEIQKILIKIRTGKEITVGDDTIIETLLTAYEKEKEKNENLIKERATEIVYVDKNFIKKDKIKPI